MIFYGDSFNQENNGWITDLKSTIKIEYEEKYNKEFFRKLYNLFKNDKNVTILIFDDGENKND